MGRMFEAVGFAARAHRHQLRKDGLTPYVSHVVRVSLVVQQIFDIHDDDAICIALLHDTIEDTATDYDDLLAAFGECVADGVAMLTKDMRLRDEQREAAYGAVLAGAPWRVQAVKLADVYDNLLDGAALTREQRLRVLRRTEAYLGYLAANLRREAATAYRLVQAHFEQFQRA